MMKVAFLSSELSGYMASCQKELQSKHAANLIVFHWPTAGNAPFHKSTFEHVDVLVEKNKQSDLEIIKSLEDFGADIVIMSGWMDKTYMKVAKVLKSRGTPVVAFCDTQWKGSSRQKLAGWLAPWYLHKSIDYLWVTGERQRVLAHHLGYTGQKCISGAYACDWKAFAHSEKRNFHNSSNAFLYVGRLIHRKGIHNLIQAYQTYRKSTTNPWELWIAGTGDLESQLMAIEGVKNLGFVQPDSLPHLLQKVKAFVLPSLVEPWGVALQEAAAAGLPIIASDACGAAVHLLTPNFNGYIFETGNSKHLQKCLENMSGLEPNTWESWSHNSYQLSRQFTPEIWAEKLVQILKNHPKNQ